ncbi:MAG: hypothetical protein R3Y16_02190 [Rikenellaceae bacterium]
MRKNYNLLSRTLSATLLLGAVLLGSCVNDEYDLDKLDTTVNVGGSISLPVGSTEQILIGKMLDVDDIDMLELDGDTYAIKMDDSVDIEIDKLAGTDGVSISKISDQEIVSTDFTNPSIPAFDLDFPSQSITVTPSGISSVDAGVSSAFNESIAINASLSSIPTAAGVSFADQSIPVTLGSSSVGLIFGEGITCPEQVVEIKDFKIGSVATLIFDVTALSDLFEADGFSLTIPDLKLTFPEGFSIDGGSNVLEKSDVAYADGALGFSFEITSYDKSVTVKSDGSVDPIEGDVLVALSDNLLVSGTTSGQSSSSDGLSLNLLSNISAEDMTLVVQNISTTVDDIAELSSAVDVEVSTLIEGVTKVTMDSSSNKIDIAIDAITLPDGLTATGNNIKIVFPYSKFTLSVDSDLTYNAGSGDYELAIPVSVLLDGTGFKKSVEIHEIKFDSDSVVKGEDTNVLKIDPAISMSGTTITMAGELALSQFNSFVSTEQNVTTAVTTNGLLIADAEIITSDYVADLGEITTQITESVSIPDELVRIDSMLFTKQIYVNMDISVELAGTDAELSFENYTIDFPDFIRFAEGTGVDANNVLKLNDTFTQDGDTRIFTKKLEICAIDFTDEKYASLITGSGDDKVLTIDESVTMSGEIKMASSAVSSDELTTKIEAVVDISIDEMTIQSVYGVVNPDIETEQQVIDLSDLSEINDGGELDAVLSNPVIEISILNTLSVPAQINSLDITTTKSGDKIQTISIGETISVAAADENGASTTLVYISAYDAPEAPAEGVQYVKMEGLKSVLMDLPDELLIDFDASVVELDGQNHFVDLYTDYKFELNYEINVPLSFESLTLDYTTTVDDLAGTMADLSQYISNIVLKLTAENTIPLALEISEVTPYDVNGDKLTGLSPIISEGDAIIAANTTSTLELTLDDNGSGELEYLEALDIRIEASASETAGGATLKSTQYLQIKISAQLPDGLTISSNDDEE